MTCNVKRRNAIKEKIVIWSFYKSSTSLFHFYTFSIFHLDLIARFIHSPNYTIKAKNKLEFKGYCFMGYEKQFYGKLLGIELEFLKCKKFWKDKYLY